MKILCILFAFVLGMLIMDYIVSRDLRNEINKAQENANKLFLYYKILNMWIQIKQANIDIGDYMRQQGYNCVAIYGMKELGERLYKELQLSGIEIVCVVDSNKYVLGNFKLLSPDEVIPPVDLLIVTADYYFNEIELEMREKVNCPIVSLSGLLGRAFGRNV